MQFTTLAKMLATKPANGQFADVQTDAKRFVFRENAPGLTPDGVIYFASTVPGREDLDRWELSRDGDPDGGTGPGGAAYPDNIKLVSEDTTLTSDDQGIVFCTGGVVTLPASAPNGTTFKFLGSPGDVIINTNGATIIGLGSGSAIEVGDPNLHIVAFNIPTLVWGIANKKNAGNYQPDRTYIVGDIVTENGSRYLSLIDNNINQPTSDTAKWLALDGRVVTGSIALSDMSFTGTTPPAAGGAAYAVTQLSSNAVLLDILMNFPTPGTGITETTIGIVKASEIRDAIGNMLVGGDEDLFGIGHVASNSGFGSAVPVTAIYSPTNLEYIKAKHASTNIAEGKLQFVIRRP